MSDPIHDVVDRWHRHLRGALPGGLDELIDEDCVFHSPIVFTPQRGGDVTRMYLEAAFRTLPGDGATGNLGSVADPGSDPSTSGSGDATPADRVGTAFRYTKEVLSGHQAVLEFETTVDGKYVNGVDIITCDDRGSIVEFRVMIRPLQAVNLVHARMRDMLEAMAAPGD